MIYNILINAITGAGTGYITNNIAIKMLFKKYFGRFGGIIEDTHDEFVENMAQLIEKDLINHSTLKEEFQSENFHNYIKELIKDMFLYSLPKNSIALKEIHGIDTTTDNAVNFLEKNKKHTKAIKKKIALRPVKSAISSLQALHFSKKVSKLLHKHKSDYLSTSLKAMKEFKSNKLISEELFEQLQKNLHDILHDINVSKYDKSINLTVYKLLELIDIDKVLNTTKEEFQKITFRQLFSTNDGSTKEFLNQIIAIALSKEGNIAIQNSIDAVLEALKKVDVSILSLVGDEVKESIKSFIKNKLPNIIYKIIEFIDENEKELEVLINSSIDKALSDGMFADFKKKVVNIFYTNLVADFQVLNKIKQHMNEYRGKAEDEISNQLIDILQNKSIGELYTKVSNRGIITSEKVTKHVIKNLQNVDTKKDYYLLNTILDKHLKEYIDIDIGQIKEEIIPKTITKIKTDFLYSEKFTNFIIQKTDNFIEEFKLKTVENIFSSRLETLSEQLTNLIDEDKLLNIILENSNKVLHKPIKEVINIDELNIEYRKYIDDIVYGKSIKEIISYLESEEVYIAIEHALIKVIIDNLEEILRGNVSEAVKKELTKLQPTQIKEMVEEFMGEELKPINYFGAVLGAGAGAGVGAISMPIWINPFVYAIVGVATNYLAIKMLFQPYTPLKIGKFKVPFSEGVLPSNKDKMATKMSEFVDEFMLNGTSIQDFFKNNSENLKSFIKEHIAQDNYAILDKIIHQNSNIDDVSNEAINLIFNFLDKNKEMIHDKIYNISMDYYDKREKYASSASSLIYKEIMKKDFKEIMYELFDKFIHRDKSLTFMDKELYFHLDKMIDMTFESTMKLLNSSKERELLAINLDEKFQKFAKNTTLNDIVDSDIKRKISLSMNHSVLNLFYGDSTINELLSFFTKGEFGTHSKLSDMINGMLPRIIESNLQAIITDTILPLLRENKKIIRKQIMQKVPFGMGWAVKRDVNRTIDIILDKEIPDFINNKLNQINNIIQEILNSQLLDLGYTNEVIKQEKIDNLTDAILNDPEFERAFLSTMKLFLERVFDMKLQSILKMFNINSLLDINKVFEPNIQALTNTLHDNIELKNEEILITIKNFMKNDVLDDILHSLSLGDILKNVDKKILINEFEFLQNNLKSSKIFQKNIQDILNKFITFFIKEEFLDKKIFKDDLEKFLHDIREDKEQLRSTLVPFFKEFLIHINNILDLKLKDHMLDIIIESAFLSIDKKIMELMGAIDFKKVITKEIQEMHPKELEDMFYSFAGPYFNKLILYGSLGFIFGLATLFQF